MAQDNTALGITNFVYRIKGRIGQQQGVGVGVAHILAGKYNHPSGNKFDILATFNHAGQPINGAIRITAPHAFYKSADNVIVLLALLVV